MLATFFNMIFYVKEINCFLNDNIVIELNLQQPNRLLYNLVNNSQSQ